MVRTKVGKKGPEILCELWGNTNVWIFWHCVWSLLYLYETYVPESKNLFKKKKSNSINYPDSRVSVLNPEVGESGFYLSL